MTSARMPGMVRTGTAPAALVSGLDGLHLELDLHLVADDHTAGLEHHVPGQVPVLATDVRFSSKAGTNAAPRILLDTFELELEVDRPGLARDHEVTRHDVVVAVGLD